MGFSRLKDVLAHIRRNHPGLSKRIDEGEALNRWEDAVGPLIAKHTQPKAVHQGVLTVEVSHPAWQTELHHRQRQILEKLNEALGPVTPAEWLIKELHFIEPARKKPKFSNSTFSKENTGKKRFPPKA